MSTVRGCLSSRWPGWAWGRCFRFSRLREKLSWGWVPTQLFYHRFQVAKLFGLGETKPVPLGMACCRHDHEGPANKEGGGHSHRWVTSCVCHSERAERWAATKRSWIPWGHSPQPGSASTASLRVTLLKFSLLIAGMTCQGSDHLLWSIQAGTTVFSISSHLTSSHTTFFHSYHIPATVHFLASNSLTQFCLRAFALTVHLAWNVPVRILWLSPIVQVSAQPSLLQQNLLWLPFWKCPLPPQATLPHHPSLYLSPSEMILFTSLLTILSPP